MFGKIRKALNFVYELLKKGKDLGLFAKKGDPNL